MSRSLTAWSRRVSLVCRFPIFSFLAKPLTAVSEKSRLLSAGFRTGARRRRRVAEEGFHL
jgi:hypothetical protein